MEEGKKEEEQGVEKSTLHGKSDVLDLPVSSSFDSLNAAPLQRTRPSRSTTRSSFPSHSSSRAKRSFGTNSSSATSSNLNTPNGSSPKLGPNTPSHPSGANGQLMRNSRRGKGAFSRCARECLRLCSRCTALPLAVSSSPIGPRWRRSWTRSRRSTSCCATTSTFSIHA
jgi:hypothetical protein